MNLVYRYLVPKHYLDRWYNMNLVESYKEQHTEILKIKEVFVRQDIERLEQIIGIRYENRINQIAISREHLLDNQNALRHALESLCRSIENYELKENRRTVKIDRDEVISSFMDTQRYPDSNFSESLRYGFRTVQPRSPFLSVTTV